MDELSGGQFVLVNEAVNLGIAIYNMRQGESIRYETLFRDETVGALDAVNGKEYVRMLRRAMDLGVAHISNAVAKWLAFPERRPDGERASLVGIAEPAVPSKSVGQRFFLKIPDKGPAMYVMAGGICMTYGDRKFMMEVGIEPCTLDDPFPRPLPPRLPPGPLIPKLTEKDACWILNLGVRWEQEPEPDFIPPKSLREYLARYPNGIREAVEVAAKRLGLDLSDDDLDDLAQDIVAMFLDFSIDLEDVVEMYVTCPPPRPGRCRSQHFHLYIRLRVRAALRTLLRDRVPRPGEFR